MYGNLLNFLIKLFFIKEKHLKSKKHLKRKLANKNKDIWNCILCKIKLPNEGEWVIFLFLFYYYKDKTFFWKKT